MNRHSLPRSSLASIAMSLRGLNGSHQPLDLTLKDDRYRVRRGNGLLVLGLFRRFVVSLYLDWRCQQPQLHQKSLTDFQNLMEEDNLAGTFAFVTAPRSNLSSKRYTWTLGTGSCACFRFDK